MPKVPDSVRGKEDKPIALADWPPIIVCPVEDTETAYKISQAVQASFKIKAQAMAAAAGAAHRS